MHGRPGVKLRGKGDNAATVESLDAVRLGASSNLDAGNAAESSTTGSDIPEHSLESDALNVLLVWYDGVKTPSEDIWDFGDNSWLTPLHYAVLQGNRLSVRNLLESRTFHRHINARDYHHKTALHMAVSHPKGNEVLQILSQNAAVDYLALDCCLYTPLHWAVRTCNVYGVKHLTSPSLDSNKKARGTWKDAEGLTPLLMGWKQAAKVMQGKLERHKDNWRYLNSTADGASRSLPCEFNYSIIEQDLLGCDDVKNNLARLSAEKRVLENATNAMLVAAVVTVGMTFQTLVTFSLPDPLHDEALYYVYLAFLSLALCSSLVAVICGVTVMLPTQSHFSQSLTDHGAAVMTFSVFFGISNLSLLVSVVVHSFTVYSAHHGHPFTALNIITIAELSIFAYFGPSYAMFLVDLWLYHSNRKPRTSSPPIFLPVRNFRTKLENAWQMSWGPNPIPPPVSDEVLRLSSVLDRALGRQGSRAAPIRNLRGIVRVYEETRKELYNRRRRDYDNMKFLSNTGVLPRELHFWLRSYSVETCRELSIRLDQERFTVLIKRCASQVAKYREMI